MSLSGALRCKGVLAVVAAVASGCVTHLDPLVAAAPALASTIDVAADVVLGENQLRQAVYVRNPELTRELEILERAEVFDLSDDPSFPIHLVLEPLSIEPVPQQRTGINELLRALQTAIYSLTLGIYPDVQRVDVAYGFEVLRCGAAEACPADERSTYRVEFETSQISSLWGQLSRRMLTDEQIVAQRVADEFRRLNRAPVSRRR